MAFSLKVEAPRRRRILHLALPIIGGMISQNVLNLVDAAMVGSFGDDALAAVGVGGFLNFLLTAFILGLSAGVQAMASRRVGEGREDESAVPLNGGLLIALVVATPLSALLIWLAPYYFPLVVDDPHVLDDGVPYLRWRLCAMVAMGMNFSFRGYWNAVDKSALYMRTLIVMHASNIAMNYVFIFGALGAPELGAQGAGLASMISTYIGLVMYFGLGLKHARGASFLAGLPGWETIRTMVRVSAPAGLQQFFFAAGMTVFMTIMARVGTQELAASKVIIDLMLVGILPGIGFGLAAASLVGQALGREDPDDATRWAWDVVRIATVVVALIALPAVAAPDLLLRPFLHEADTRALAAPVLRWVACFLATDAIGLVLMNAMIGAGYTRRVMVISTALQWALFLPLAYLMGPVLGWGMLAVWLGQIGYRQIQTVAFVLEIRRGRWLQAKV